LRTNMHKRPIIPAPYPARAIRTDRTTGSRAVPDLFLDTSTFVSRIRTSSLERGRRHLLEDALLPRPAHVVGGGERSASMYRGTPLPFSLLSPNIGHIWDGQSYRSELNTKPLREPRGLLTLLRDPLYRQVDFSTNRPSAGHHPRDESG